MNSLKNRLEQILKMESNGPNIKYEYKNNSSEEFKRLTQNEIRECNDLIENLKNNEEIPILNNNLYNKLIIVLRENRKFAISSHNHFLAQRYEDLLQKISYKFIENRLLESKTKTVTNLEEQLMELRNKLINLEVNWENKII